MKIVTNKKANEYHKYQTFGSRLDDTMFCQNITNQELAKKMFVSSSTISGYRTGRRSPSVTDLAALSKILDVSADYLIGLKDEP